MNVAVNNHHTQGCLRLLNVILHLEKMRESQRMLTYEVFYYALVQLAPYLNPLQRQYGNDDLVLFILCSPFSKVCSNHIPEHQVAAFVWETPKCPYLCDKYLGYLLEKMCFLALWLTRSLLTA